MKKIPPHEKKSLYDKISKKHIGYKMTDLDMMYYNGRMDDNILVASSRLRTKYPPRQHQDIDFMKNMKLIEYDCESKSFHKSAFEDEVNKERQLVIDAHEQRIRDARKLRNDNSAKGIADHLKLNNSPATQNRDGTDGRYRNRESWLLG